MREVKKPKKPLVFYYLIVIGVLLLLNTFLFPNLGALADLAVLFEDKAFFELLDRTTDPKEIMDYINK